MSVMVGPKRHAGLMQNSPAKFLNDQVYREDVDISAGYYIHHHKLGEGNFFSHFYYRILFIIPLSSILLQIIIY